MSRQHSLRLAVLLSLLSAVLIALAAEPVWWLQRGVIAINPGTGQRLPSQDYAVINQGQLKNLVAAAVAELNANLPNGAGTALTTLVASWNAAPTGDRQDHAMVNIGQLKTVAKLVYDRLIAEGAASTHPWELSVSDSADFALANIGQAKALFAFDLTSDVDNDGLNWIQETQSGTDQSIADTDGDGFPDGQDTYPLNAMMHAAPQANPSDMIPPVLTLVKPADAQRIL